MTETTQVELAKKPTNSHGLLFLQATLDHQKRIQAILESKNISQDEFLILTTLLWCHENRKEPSPLLIAKHAKLNDDKVIENIRSLATRKLVKPCVYEKNRHIQWIYLTKKGFDLVTKLVLMIGEIEK